MIQWLLENALSCIMTVLWMSRIGCGIAMLGIMLLNLSACDDATLVHLTGQNCDCIVLVLSQTCSAVQSVEGEGTRGDT